MSAIRIKSLFAKLGAFALTLSLACSISMTSVAQDTAESATSDSGITMNMRDADIRSVIQWVSDLTGKNILVHNAVQGKVTVISGGTVSEEEAYQLFLSTLQINGFAAQEKNGVITIVPDSIAAQGHAPFSASNGSEVITKIIPVSHIPATQLISILKPLLPQHSQLSADPSSNSLIAVDRADNIAKIESIVKRMDKPGNGEFDMVKLRHANATDVVQSLSTLVPAMSDPSTGALTVNFSVDERSNSILMFGDPAKRKNLRGLISRLDQPVSGDGSTQVVYLNYVDSAELVPILQSMAGARAVSEGKDKLNVTVDASESANALIINAPPALMADMKRVISQIDIRKAQVLIEALVVQVNNTIANDIGVNWVSTNAGLNSSDGIVGAVNTLGNLPLAIISEAVNPDTNLTETTYSAAKGLTFGFFKNGSLRAAIRALSTNTKANILSTPTIIALDNEEAELLVGQSVPFITGQATGAASSTENPFTTIQRQDIGIALRVTPRINQGDSIALKIEQTTESIDPSTSAVDIITRKTEMRTRALIKDGEVLVIGGLISDEEKESRQKVPLLGDIPLLGKLFSSKGVSKTKNNLMVFIHPVILKDAEHRRELTSKRYNFMREQQQKMSQDNWTKEYKFQPLLPEFEIFAPDAASIK